jgi:hypothetical protein
MFKINLVPEIQEKKRQISKINSIVTVSSIAILGVTVLALLVLGGMVVANKTTISGTGKKIDSTNNELNNYKELEQEVLSLEKGLAGAKEIIDGSNTWTKLLPHLEKATPADITFKSLKLGQGKITANLEGVDINSLARFVESYKKYELYSITGSDASEGKVTITVDNQPSIQVAAKISGQWIYPLAFEPNVDHKITVVINKDQTVVFDYSATSKELKTESQQASIQKKNLFTNVEVSQYRWENKKDREVVAFEAKMDFDGAMLW